MESAPDPLIQYGQRSRKRPPRLDILGGRLRGGRGVWLHLRFPRGFSERSCYQNLSSGHGGKKISSWWKTISFTMIGKNNSPSLYGVGQLSAEPYCKIRNAQRKVSQTCYIKQLFKCKFSGLVIRKLESRALTCYHLQKFHWIDALPSWDDLGRALTLQLHPETRSYTNQT